MIDDFQFTIKQTMTQLASTSAPKISNAHKNLLLAWAYARRELVFISWALMEVSLITPLSLAILPWTDEWWGRQRLFIGFLLLMLTSFYFARFVYWLKLPERNQKSILLVAGSLLLFFAIRNINYQPESLFDFSWIRQSLRNLAVVGNNLWLRDLFLLGLAALSWWRGMMLLNREVDVIRIGKRFRFGVLFLAPLTILLASVRLDWSVLPFLLFFFIISLTAVALTRAASTENEQTAVLAALSPRWLGMVTSASVIVTFLGSATAVLFSNLSIKELGQGLAPVWNALRWGGQTIGLTIGFLIAPFLSSIERIIQFLIYIFKQGFNALFVKENALPPPAPDQTNELLEAYNEWYSKQQLDGNGIFSNVNWRFVIIGVALLIALLIIQQYYRKNLIAQGNSRFGKILIDLSNRIIPTRLRRNRNKKKERNWDNWRAAVSIIRIYQQMITLCGDLSTPRHDSETPYEYLQTLKTVWPNHVSDCQIITQAYVKVRYGEFPETKEEFKMIKSAWKRVRETAVSPLQNN